MILNLPRHLRAALAALLLAAALAPAALADEGMWAFNNLPRAEIKRRYGFEVTDEWVRRVQSATVRFPNGTGSFVSSEGLVLTSASCQRPSATSPRPASSRTRAPRR